MPASSEPVRAPLDDAIEVDIDSRFDEANRLGLASADRSRRERRNDGHAWPAVVNPFIYDNVKYDGVRNFTVIAQLGSDGNLLVVPTRIAARNLAEFVAYL